MSGAQQIQKHKGHERDPENHTVRGLYPSPPDQRTHHSEAREPVAGGWYMR